MKKISTPKIIGLLFCIFFMAGAVSPAIAAPRAADVSVSGDGAKSGIPGSVVTYTLTLTNNDAVALDVTVEAVSAGGWTTPVVLPDSFTLGAAGSGDESQDVIVNVPIPSSATDGQNDIATIYFRDSLNNDIKTKQLTTTASVPAVSGRPLVVVASYSTGDASVYAGREFTLTLVMKNNGQIRANNIVITFDGAEFYPQETGGVRTIGHLDSGAKNTVTQKFIIGDSLAWQGVTSLKANITYTDPSGTSYSESFTLTVKITPPAGSGVYYTPTPNIPLRPQLMVIGYKTDVDPLQPGTLFTLQLDIKNLGRADAKTVTVVLGGGGSSGSGESGTPQPGGVSGAAGDLANFAPIGSSNLIYVGDIAQGSTISVTQKLVVNTTTQPGAYSLKMSFVYDDPKGNRLVDDQVITLLVYKLPQVEISFYRDPGIFTMGMENILPIQVTNLGKTSTVLGNMKVTAENAEVLNNVSLVGALDPGGYYTLDATLLPNVEGPMELKVSINYTDDFNQPRFVEQTIPIEVQSAPEIEPGLEGTPVDGKPNGGINVEPSPETFWAKVGRFFKGLFGLGSGTKQPIDSGLETPAPDQYIPAIPKG